MSPHRVPASPGSPHTQGGLRRARELLCQKEPLPQEMSWALTRHPLRALQLPPWPQKHSELWPPLATPHPSCAHSSGLPEQPWNKCTRDHSSTRHTRCPVTGPKQLTAGPSSQARP